jgi:hypothetical protein
VASGKSCTEETRRAPCRPVFSALALNRPPTTSRTRGLAPAERAVMRAGLIHHPTSLATVSGVVRATLIDVPFE